MILKPCPFCHKDIPRSITVCPYCHRDEQGKSVVIDTATEALTLDSGFREDLKQLASDDPFVRDHAVVRMANRGKPAAMPLLEVLRDFTKPGLAGVAKVLGKLGDARAIPVLAQAAKVGDEELRMASVWALAQFREPEALTVLLAESERPHPVIQGFVAHALGTFQDPRVGPALSKLALHQHRDIAFQAVCALGELGAKDNGPVLQRVWRKGDPLVRAASVTSLRRLGLRPSVIYMKGFVFGIVVLSLLSAGLGWFFYK